MSDGVVRATSGDPLPSLVLTSVSYKGHLFVM